MDSAQPSFGTRGSQVQILPLRPTLRPTGEPDLPIFLPSFALRAVLLGLCLLASPSYAVDLPGPDEYLAYGILPPPDELLLAGIEMEAAGLVHVLDRSTAELDRYCLDRLPGYGLTAGTHFDACTVPPAADGDVCIILISTAHGARKRELVLNHEYAHCAKWDHPMVWR